MCGKCTIHCIHNKTNLRFTDMLGCTVSLYTELSNWVFYIRALKSNDGNFFINRLHVKYLQTKFVKPCFLTAPKYNCIPKAGLHLKAKSASLKLTKNTIYYTNRTPICAPCIKAGLR